MGYQSVGWWRKHGRRFNVPANSLSVPGGATRSDYARRQTHPVLVVDHGWGNWKISDGEHTIRSRRGKRVWGYVVPASAFKGASAGCLMLTAGLAVTPVVTLAGLAGHVRRRIH